MALMFQALQQDACLRLKIWCGVLALAVLAGCASENMHARAGATYSDGVSVRPSGKSQDVRRKAEVRLELAQAYFEQGRNDIALNEVAQSLTHDPDYAKAYSLQGLIYLQRRDNARALQSLRTAVAHEPGNGEILNNYGYALCEAGRFADAQVQFDAALADADYAGRQKTLLASGVCQARAGQLEQAEATLRRAYELAPSSPAVGYNFANVLHRAGKSADAQFYLRRVNNSDRANAQSLWLGVRVERALGNQAAERQLADQLRRRYPESQELVAYERGGFEE